MLYEIPKSDFICTRRNFLNHTYFTSIFFTPWTWDKRMPYSKVVKFGCRGYSVSMRWIEQIMYSSDPWYCCLTDILPAGNTSILDNMEEVCCTAWLFYRLSFYYILWVMEKKNKHRICPQISEDVYHCNWKIQTENSEFKAQTTYSDILFSSHL